MPKPGPKNLPRKNNPFNILFVVALLGAGLALVFQGEELMQSQEVETIALSEMLKEYEKGAYNRIEVKDQTLKATTTEGTLFEAIKEPGSTITDLGFNDQNQITEIEIMDTSGRKTWINLLIGLAPFALLIVLFLFFTRKAGGMGESGPFGFGKSKAKVYDKSKHETKFQDVAGAEEAKEDVFEVVDFLKNPKKYEKAGAKLPKGILMVGPPGTGKTLLARAIAGEANVPFFSVSGSEFVEMFVGVGASRVRDLFKTAKQNAPAIIFIDEIDAIGKKRSQGSGSGGHDEREQTLNQILTEMDGFEPETSIIVIAATNRPDVLDKALLRPGRFDRQVHVDLPDMAAREKILKVHSKGKTLAKKTNLKEVSKKTVGFSGAELESVMNEAAIRSVKFRKKSISQEDLLQSVEKVAIGPERHSRKFTLKERKMTAFHEVGHAIAGHFCEHHDPVHKISIVSRGRALGLTWFLPDEDVYSKTKARLMDEMVGLHGGRIAERIVFGEDHLTTGASNDLERISNIARSMVMRFGMSTKVGPVNFISGEYEAKPHSEATAREIDQEVQKFIEDAEKKCETILKKHRKLLDQMSKDLLEKENISRDEFLAYFPEETKSSKKS